MVGTRPCGFEGMGKERSCYSICSKGTLLATFADPFNSTIHNHSSIVICAATTKMPHLLYEEALLETRKWCMILFYNMIYLQWIWWEWENPPPEKQGKKSPFGCPPIPPVNKIGSRLFSGTKELKTSLTYSRLDWDPNLQG